MDPADPLPSSQPVQRNVQSDEPGSPAFNLTFISIHDLSADSRILYSSESIVDVLGYTPGEVVNRSVWDFFSEDDLAVAKSFHKRGVEQDKAAMLVYCRIRDRQGEWVGCEVCFTIVYDVMVVCTSIYRSTSPSHKRAVDAPVIRRLFTSSPKDPRYHMLSHLSHKFRYPSKTPHEPRAALFLNRFTRTLTIMYATTGIEEILGIPSSSLQGKSFYYCIAENCLSDAVRCLENAKGNDSIAYLRFFFRNPLSADPPASSGGDDSDEEMTTDTSVDQGSGSRARSSPRSNAMTSDEDMEMDRPSDDNQPQSRTSSGAESGDATETHEAIFDTRRVVDSSASSAPESVSDGRSGSIELEAVISCTSDGLVVCLRRARPIVPTSPDHPGRTPYENGLFAAPWASEPVVPHIISRPQTNSNSTFAPALGPHGADTHITAAGGPDRNDFMAAIRDQAIFAWALTGINGSLHKFASGSPRGESVPSSGLPVWQSDSHSDSGSSDKHCSESGSSSTIVDGAARDSRSNSAALAIGNDHRRIFGDPGLKHSRKTSAATGSGDDGSKAA